MKIIVYLIILLGVCYFLYKINSDIWNTKKTKKKSNYKNEVDAIIDETLYKHKKPINMQDKYLNADNQEESVNTNKSNEKIIQVPQSESIHKNSAIDLKTEIKNILANKPATRITYKDCMTQKYKSDVCQSYKAIQKIFAEKQMDIDELEINILENKLDYVNDILVPVDNHRQDSFDELTLNIKSTELPLTYILSPKAEKSEELSQINRFFKHCSIQKVTTNRNATGLNKLKDYVVHNSEIYCNHIAGAENMTDNSNLIYYLINECDIKRISKRLGKRIFISQIYCYCPICKKLVCTNRKEDELGVVNLLEYTSMGKRILNHVEQCVNDSLENKKRLGYCYDFWNLKESMLLDEFNLIWYSPVILNPIDKYD